MLIIMISILTPAFAQGEHGRRAAAELAVVLGDVRKLETLNSNEQSALLRKGLIQRIEGGLSALDILFRLADQETGNTARNYNSEVTIALEHAKQNKLAALKSHLLELQALFPLEIPTFDVSDQNVADALEQHTQLCAACHDYPATGVERPAYNLYEQAAATSHNEFFARMLVGVRGDRITGIDNPFTDIQLISLITLYKNANPASAQQK